ncbi:6-bladed beta-propeller [Marinoscillum sp.]|uniref:6-bladed beta-propeller n=1 Tax=Marinoscillum sp. TaxID=2024838 RepID=UPI003BAD6944
MNTLLKATGFLLLAIVFSCSDSPQESDENLAIPVTFQRTINLSELVDTELSYIPLQSKEAPLIGEIQKVAFTDSLIYVLDKYHLQTVLIFRGDGSFVGQVGSVGEGVGEYQYISDFILTEAGIEIADSHSQKVIQYSFAGHYDKEWKVPFMISEMELAGNNRRWVYSPYDIADTAYNQVLYLLDSTYTTIEQSYFPYENVIDDAPFPGYMTSYDGHMTYTKPLLGEYYQFNSSNGQKEFEMKVDFEPYGWPISRKELTSETEAVEEVFRKGNVMTMSHQLTETEGFITLWTLMRDPDFVSDDPYDFGDPWLCIYHKKSGKLLAVQNVINDLDDGLFALPIATHRDQLIGVLNVERLLEQAEPGSSMQSTSSIAQIMDSLTQESNPVLMRYRLNDGLFDD